MTFCDDSYPCLCLRSWRVLNHRERKYIHKTEGKERYVQRCAEQAAERAERKAK